MRRLTALLLLLYFLGFSVSLCLAETEAKRVARRPIASADQPQGGAMDALQAPLTAAEVEQARRRRDVVPAVHDDVVELVVARRTGPVVRGRRS